MATITLEIDEKTKKGQTFIDFLKQYILNDNAVEIVRAPNKKTLEAIKEVEQGKTEKITLSQFRKQLGI